MEETLAVLGADIQRVSERQVLEGERVQVAT